MANSTDDIIGQISQRLGGAGNQIIPGSAGKQHVSAPPPPQNMAPPAGAAAGPPQSRPMGPMQGIMNQPMMRKSGGRVSQKEAKRLKAIADALRLIAQSPEFGAFLRGVDGESTQKSPPRR